MRTCEDDALGSSYSLLSDAILSSFPPWNLSCPARSESDGPSLAPDLEDLGNRRDLHQQLNSLRSLIVSATPANVNQLENALQALTSASSFACDKASVSSDSASCSSIDHQACSLQLASTAHRDYARAFYCSAAMLNHSCAPNTLLACDSI